MADAEEKSGDERDLPAGLPVAMLVGTIIVCVATLALLLVST